MQKVGVERPFITSKWDVPDFVGMKFCHLLRKNLKIRFTNYFKWRRSVGMYILYDTRSQKWTNFFLVNHWGPKPPGNPSELIFALLGGLRGPFFKF